MSFWKKIKDENVKKSLRASDRDGLFWSIMVGFGQNFIKPFAIALKATNMEIALLESLPNLVSSFVQPFAADFVDNLRLRKKIVFTTVMMQAFIWLPLLGLPLLLRSRAVPLLIILYTVYVMLGRFTTPAWISWMGDLVPEKLRGQYFGHRNTIIQVATVISTLAAGAVLGFFENTNEMIGFAAIFVIASIARFISGGFITQMDEPEYKPLKEERFTLGTFITRLPKSNYGRFVIFNVLFRAATAFASPFFALYMLRDLQYPYFGYTAVIVSFTISKVLTIRYWGKYGDRFGNIKVIRLTALLIPLAPILWLVSTNIWWIVLINFYAGIVWGGFELASANFLFDSIRPTKRARVFAYHDTLHGILLFTGAMLGGFFSIRVPILWNLPSNLLTIFLISGLLRLLIAIIFIPRFKEVREVEHVTGIELLFGYMAFEPLEDAIYGAFNGARYGARLARRLRQKSMDSVKTVVSRPLKGKKPD